MPAQASISISELCLPEPFLCSLLPLKPVGFSHFLQLLRLLNTEHFFTPPRDTGSGCDQGDILPVSQPGLAFYQTCRNAPL